MGWANRITLTRIAFIPVIVLFLYLPMPWTNVAAAILFAVAAFTDTLDGYVARKNNEITTMGKFLDPIADKILVCSVMICLVAAGEITALSAILVIVREFVVSGVRLVAAQAGSIIAADTLGKWKTIFQDVAITMLIVHNWPFYYVHIPLAQIVWYLSVALTLVSGVHYLYQNRKLFTNKKGDDTK